jgi:hypothetical protein
MNTNGHLMYGGSGASNMVAKIISTNQRQFNLNKMKHPSANLQRRYGDGSFEIDDSYWRQPPPPHRWDGGVARNTQQIPQMSSPQSTPRNIFDTPKIEIPQPQFIQLTPQLSIPVQNLQNQTQQRLPMSIAKPTPREDFQPPAPKLSKKVSKVKFEEDDEEDEPIDERDGSYFRPQGKLVQTSGNFNKFSSVLNRFKSGDENYGLVKKAYKEYVSSYNELIEELNNQKERIKKYIKSIDDETQIKKARKQLDQVRDEYKNPKALLERATKMYEKIKK